MEANEHERVVTFNYVSNYQKKKYLVLDKHSMMIHYTLTGRAEQLLIKIPHCSSKTGFYSRKKTVLEQILILAVFEMYLDFIQTVLIRLKQFYRFNAIPQYSCVMNITR